MVFEIAQLVTLVAQRNGFCGKGRSHLRGGYFKLQMRKAQVHQTVCGSFRFQKVVLFDKGCAASAGAQTQGKYEKQKAGKYFYACIWSMLHGVWYLCLITWDRRHFSVPFLLLLRFRGLIPYLGCCGFCCRAAKRPDCRLFSWRLRAGFAGWLSGGPDFLPNRDCPDSSPHPP